MPESKSEEYRRRAAQCDEWSKIATTPQNTEEFRRMAEQWRLMAEQAERYGW